MLHIILLLGLQIDCITNIKHCMMQVKIEKKRTVAVKVDVEMADASKPGPSIQSLINKGLNAKLKQLNLVPGKTKVRYTPSLNSKLWVDNLSLEQADYQSKQELR